MAKGGNSAGRLDNRPPTMDDGREHIRGDDRSSVIGRECLEWLHNPISWRTACHASPSAFGYSPNKIRALTTAVVNSPTRTRHVRRGRGAATVVAATVAGLALE